MPVEEALEGLSRLGAREAAEAAAEKYAEEARRLAEKLPWSQEAKDMFEELVSFLSEREA